MTPELRVELADGGELRPLTPDDVTPGYVAGLNDPEVHRFLVAARVQRQTMESVRAYVAANAADDRAILFGLYVDGTLSGTVRLHDVEPGGAAHVGIALFDRRIWGVGWARRCLVALVEVARGLGVRELVAGIAAENEASQRAFAAAGFAHDPSADGHATGLATQRWVRPL